MAKIPAYATVSEIFVILRDMDQGISENMIRRHIQKAGVKQTAKKQYNTAKVLEAIHLHRQEDNKNAAHSQPTGLKAAKIALECQILRLKIDEMRGLTIPLAEHLSEMRAMQGHWNSTLDYFVCEASALTKDAHLLDRLDHLVTNTRKMLVAKIEATDDRVKGAEG